MSLTIELNRKMSPQNLSSNRNAKSLLLGASCPEWQTQNPLLEVFHDELGCSISLYWMGPGLCVQSFRMKRRLVSGMGREAFSSSELSSMRFAVSLCYEECFSQISTWTPFSSMVVKPSESICYLHGAWTSWWLWSIWPDSKS